MMGQRGPAHGPRYGAAIFDFDGTVADTLPLIYAAFDAALTEPLGRRLSEREIRAHFGPPDQEILRRLLPPGQAGAAHERYLAVYEREHGRLVRAFDGMEALLRSCRAAGMALGLVTGKSRQTALLSLGLLGLADLFEVVVAGDDVRDPKPHPEGVLAAVEVLGRRDGMGGVYIGDSAADILAGRAAGLSTIGVTWGSPDLEELRAARPDVMCDRVSDLAAALGVDHSGT